MTRATEFGGARPTHHGGGPPGFGGAGGFMGFASGGSIEEMEEVKDGWFTNKEDHCTLGGGYTNVHIYITGKGYDGLHKWSRTDMFGTLRVI